MAVWHGEAGRKITGGKIHLARKKRKYELGSHPLLTTIGAEKRKVVRTRGGGRKVKAAAVEFANVYNPRTKETKKVKILDVLENPANPHYVRRKIITRGAIVQTEIGKARITSRPSQHGVANAIKLEEK
jgi:small subunit ribosomal protein S8e